jgi:hypothetical protein
MVCFLSCFLFPHLGEGLAFAKRTLLCKKPNTIDLIIRFFRSNGICLFDSPPDAGMFVPYFDSPTCESRDQTSRNALFYGVFFFIRYFFIFDIQSSIYAD